jgi:hypothetical protein
VSSVEEPLIWTRGLARLDGGRIVLDPERADEYEVPRRDPGVVYDLAAIHKPSDTLRFVREHGLLWVNVKTDNDDDRAWNFPEPRFSEPFAAWETTARDFREILAAYEQLQAAALRGENWLSGPLAESAKVIEQKFADMPAQTPAAAFVQTVHVAPEGNAFRLEGHPIDLEHAAWYELMTIVVESVPLRRCIECGRFFPITDQRKRFCSTQCAGRARYRRYAAKKRKQEEER